MRAEQRTILSARQTGERAVRLLEWLDQSRPMLKAQCRALQNELRRIEDGLFAIVEAVEQRPTAGLISSWGTDRSALLKSLISDTATSTPDDETRPSLNRDRLAAALPADSEGGLAASIRLLAAERVEAPYRYPIRLTLLGQLDLAKIIAAAYLLHVPPRRQAFASSKAIAGKLAMLAAELSSQTFTGLSRRDIDGLRDVLHAAAPESPVLSRFQAVGYWDSLGGLVPHLPESERRKALSLLWGEDPQLTALFETLSDGLEQMAFSSEAFTGLDALIGRDQTTGWMVRHAESVVANTTIESCRSRPEVRIRVSSRHGRGTDVERFLLASLVAECCIPAASASIPLLETADILIMPAPQPVMLWPVPGDHTSATPRIGPLSAAEALSIFTAQKAVYLAERAVRRHCITSLVVATDATDSGNGSKIDAATNALVADWIESTQGDTPHVRERQRTGLCILVAGINEGGSVPELVLAGTDQTDPRLASTIAAVLSGKPEWAQEWTPNRPFRNVFTWHPPRHQTEAIDGHSRSADILRFERARGAEVSASLPAPAALMVNQDLVNLLHAVAQATTAAMYNQQLSTRLTELRRTITARFLRLHMANDPSSTVEWRRQVSHVARNRLQHAAQAGTFGRFQKALMFTATEVEAVLEGVKAEDPRRPLNGSTDLRTLDPVRIVEACFEAWMVAMRRVAHAPSFARDIHLSGPVIAHIVDELILGSVRIGLQEKLSEAVRRIQMSAARAIDCERSVGALLGRGICAYVEALDPAAHSLRNGPHHDTPFGIGALAKPRSEAHATQRRVVPAASGLADEWAEIFSELIEANILGANLLGSTGHLNRELGDVLNAMTANLIEAVQ